MPIPSNGLIFFRYTHGAGRDKELSFSFRLACRFNSRRSIAPHRSNNFAADKNRTPIATRTPQNPTVSQSHFLSTNLFTRDRFRHRDDSAIHRQKYERLFHVSQERYDRLHLTGGGRTPLRQDDVKKANGGGGTSSDEDAETGDREDRLAASGTSADSVFTDDSIMAALREISETNDAARSRRSPRMNRTLSGSRVLDGGGGGGTTLRNRRHQSTSPPSSADQSKSLVPRPPSTVRGPVRRPLPLESLARHGTSGALDSPTSSGSVSLPSSGRRRRSVSG